MEKKECPMSQKDILFDLGEGLLAERRAFDLCRFLLTILKDEDDKKIIAKIAKDEKRHIKIVEHAIEMVKKNYNEKIQ